MWRVVVNSYGEGEYILTENGLKANVWVKGNVAAFHRNITA